ncbi:SH3 domain-containing kinase-binding protein 1 isoform X1 [Pleuronectes platessa]|uniref:SH3 domain-containing kinase-binding protein 1 isoform X1 n=1 Tax=Pleuronectes platessa TaxID=8262 RepID=UPI00232A6F7B|nr:SH3 domain-containing kinase-binding protein 1 isoform X1 [Pleuronectes platessa]XP_053296853.1 SH3 domain-containing kinase-binding protein 1 isoform X1 [Pleuronectes platessa]XP_053296854.1 SH3 domain-containing kinase-binding protein 1 isoform X1 [Pleuronectes platessa]
MGSYSSALIPDTEEFASIASAAEKLNEQIAGADERLQSELQTLATLMMEEKRKENPSEEPGASTLRENSQEASHNGPALPAAGPKPEPTPSFSSLLPQVLSAVLPQGLTSDPRPSRSPAAHTSPNLGELQTELRDLRDQFEQMKSQHNKEIKLLMSELDEEKKIRLTLQVKQEETKDQRNVCFLS